MVATMVAVVLGLTLGFGLRLVDPSPEQITWISIWGELFLRMLKMIVLPLTVCCLVVGKYSSMSIARYQLGRYAFCMVFHVRWIFLTTSLRIPPESRSDDGGIRRRLVRHFLAYFTL